MESPPTLERVGKRPLPDSCWPTQNQLWLLRAALLDKPQAQQAWDTWRSSVDLEQGFGRSSFRLFPLLYSQLSRWGLDDPIMSKLKAVYLKAWSENHQLFAEMAPLLAQLQHSGLNLMLLKGAPLVLLYYKNHALRPVGDIDVAVPSSRIFESVSCLRDLGWTPRFEIPRKLLWRLHSIDFKSQSGLELYLHWRLFFENHRPDWDEESWARSERADFQGLQVRAPCPTDLLLHMIIHGLRWNPERAIRWIPDAIIILRSDKCLEWDRFVSMVEERQLVLRIKEGLNYLKQPLDAEIPSRVLERLDGLEVTAMERMERKFALRSHEELSRRLFGPLQIFFADYWRLKYQSLLLPYLLGYPDYLAFRLGLTGKSALALFLLRSLLKRVARLVLPGIRKSIGISF